MAVTRKPWARDELLVALNLYHKLTFGQLHSRNPVPERRHPRHTHAHGADHGHHRSQYPSRSILFPQRRIEQFRRPLRSYAILPDEAIPPDPAFLRRHRQAALS